MNLDKRITFETYTMGENSIGDPIKVWVAFKSAWASATNLNGREYFVAMQVQAEQTIKFTIRYRKDIDETMRIVFNEQSYDIKFINDLNLEHKFIEILGLKAVI